jgi:glutamine cyclotransferase
MSGLVNFNDRTDRVDVLNGIAYVQATDHLLVTGKWWPNIYEVELIELQPAVALTTPLEEGS